MAIRNTTPLAREIGQIEPLAVTVGTAKRICGLGATTLWKLIANGTLDTVHVGRRTLIIYHSLKSLLSNQDEQAVVEAAVCDAKRSRSGTKRIGLKTDHRKRAAT